MTFWTAVVIIAAIIGVVQIFSRRHDRHLGVIRDEYGNPVLSRQSDAQTAAELDEARRELADLKERIQVLERIATDSNTGDARETARIAAEIEALRGTPADKPE